MSIDPNALVGKFTGSFAGIGDQAMVWVGYIVISGMILLGMFAFYIFMQYKYKTPIIKVEGGGYGKPKWDRARVVKEKGIVKWQLLIARKKIKPVPFEYIKKNKVTLLRSDSETFTPVEEKTEIIDSDGKIIINKSLIPVDKDNKYWYQLQERENAKDYQPDDLAKKQMLMMMGTVIVCLIFVGFFVWMSYKFNLGAAKEVRAGLEAVSQGGWFEQVKGMVPK